MINPETITKDQTKKEFARFAEDFNTGPPIPSLFHPFALLTCPATLPDDKYYNMEAYERRMSALRSGEYIPPANDGYDPNADMRALQNQHRKKDIERESYLSREQLEELRRVQNERVQVRCFLLSAIHVDLIRLGTQAGKMKVMGMEIKQNMGVRMDGTMFDD